MNMRNPRVDFFFQKPSRWQAEYAEMRDIVLACGLTEDLKWGQPCYTLEGKNIVVIHGFKDYCAYLFFKGALLKDDEKILVRQTEQVQSPRQVRFTEVKEIAGLRKVLTAYIYEAMEVERAGLKVKKKAVSEYEVAKEFEAAMKKNAALKTAFKALTPGRQRAYLYFFSQPKQSGTRQARIDKSIPGILKGKGLND